MTKAGILFRKFFRGDNGIVYKGFFERMSFARHIMIPRIEHSADGDRGPVLPRSEYGEALESVSRDKISDLVREKRVSSRD